MSGFLYSKIEYEIITTAINAINISTNIILKPFLSKYSAEKLRILCNSIETKRKYFFLFIMEFHIKIDNPTCATMANNLSNPAMKKSSGLYL